MPETSTARGLVTSLRRLSTFTAVAVALCGPSEAGAQQAGALGPFQHLVGGIWTGEGTWPDGSSLRVEQRYFWGPTERLLHFETWNLAQGTRDLLYEGVVYVDPVSGRVVQINVRPDGQVTRQEVMRLDATGYEIHGPDTRSVVRYGGSDLFTWELRVMQEGEWTPILTADYRRGDPPREPPRP